jgi:hypothetical protein
MTMATEHHEYRGAKIELRPNAHLPRQYTDVWVNAVFVKAFPHEVALTQAHFAVDQALVMLKRKRDRS